MRYAQIRSMDISNGDAIGVALFTQGCRFHCKNCFNQETWDLEGGQLWTDEVEDQFLELVARPHIKRVSFLGGEPLLEENIPEITALLFKIRTDCPDKKVWVYSGNTYEKLLELYPEVLGMIDVLVDGPYVDELRDLMLEYRGSSNQRVIDVQKSLDTNQVVSYLKK